MCRLKRGLKPAVPGMLTRASTRRGAVILWLFTTMFPAFRFMGAFAVAMAAGIIILMDLQHVLCGFLFHARDPLDLPQWAPLIVAERI